MLIDVRCQHCTKLLCKVSKDFFGVLQVKCHHRDCRKMNTVSLAIILKQMSETSGKIRQFPLRTSAQ